MYTIKVKWWEEESKKYWNRRLFWMFSQLSKFYFSELKCIFLKIAKVICFINVLSKISNYAITLLNL